jgi:hypothetical protein
MLITYPSAMRPECEKAILLGVSSMPSDFVTATKQELGIVDPGGRPPPSSKTYMFY